MQDNDKAKLIAMVVTILLHLLLILLMLNIYLTRPISDEEEGLEVALGIESLTSGADVADAAPVSSAEPEPTPAPQPTAPVDESYQTQNIEESLDMPDKKPQKTEEQLRKEREEREKRVAEEKARQEQERKLAEEKRKQDSIKARIAQNMKGLKGGGAGGNGTDANASGIGDGTGTGSKGNPFGRDGSTSTQGAASSGDNLSWSLAGRSLKGSLARPVYSAQEEGKVVVDIKVDKNGNVINTSVGRGTNITDASVLKAVQEAAKKTKFSPRTDGKDGDQFGQITYNLKLE
ncbi:MAG: energy transducer TonB [Paludibacteraceae bacterium]|nr:energy transducer TonB [Paludibacteraceae bacterium]